MTTAAVAVIREDVIAQILLVERHSTTSLLT
jgi:hypothetical protein